MEQGRRVSLAVLLMAAAAVGCTDSTGSGSSSAGAIASGSSTAPGATKCPRLDPVKNEAPGALLNIADHPLFHVRRSQTIAMYVAGTKATVTSRDPNILRRDGEPTLQPAGMYATPFRAGEAGSATVTAQYSGKGAGSPRVVSMTVEVAC
jgi:hypothetical protein